jgi:outer membrane protein TolC
MSLSSYEALFEMNPQNRGFNFGFSASIPLFNNFRPSLQVAQAEAAESDAKEDVRSAQLQVERQVKSALFDLENTYQVLQLAERKASLSRERLELAQEQYRNGAVSFTELQNVIDRTADAERQVVDARFGYAIAVSYLAEYAGTGAAGTVPVPVPGSRSGSRSEEGLGTANGSAMMQPQSQSPATLRSPSPARNRTATRTRTQARQRER